ncbi:hypothetical protein DSECCO2_555070 [anaerobic digester metagenome]
MKHKIVFFLRTSIHAKRSVKKNKVRTANMVMETLISFVPATDIGNVKRLYCAF